VNSHFRERSVISRQVLGRHRLGVEGVEQMLELDGFDLTALQLEFDFGFISFRMVNFESVSACVLEVLKLAWRGGG